MNIPIIHARNKGKAILIGYGIFSLLYLLSDKYSLQPAVQLQPSIIDDAVPFVSSSVVIYLSQFIFLFLAFWNDANSIKRTISFYTILLATIIASIIFLAMPTELPRHAIEPQAFLAFLWQGLYLTDTAANCFPSLHAALAVLAAQLLYSANKFWRIGAPIWAMLICISTLTTKQHYAIDLIGGIVLAITSYYLVNALLATRIIYEKTYQPD